MSKSHEEAMSLHCSNCGAQLHISSFNDKLVTCDYCGSVYKIRDLLEEQDDPQQTAQADASPAAKKASRIARTIIVLFLISTFVVPVLTGIFEAFSGDYDLSYSSDRDYGAVSWDSLVLGAIIPEFNGNDKGYIESNSSDYLSVEYKDVDESAFRSYVSSCQSAGYTAEQEYTESSFTAFNAEGYRLYMTYYSFDGDEMSITVEAPKPMSILIWPETTIAGDLPVPDSGQGYITTADEDYFTAYIGETSRDEVNTYISKCMALGFNQEQNMRDGYLWAKRSDGARLNVRYEGNNVMYISIYDNA